MAAQSFVDDLARSFLAETSTEHEQAPNKLRRPGTFYYVAIAIEKQQTVKLIFTLRWFARDRPHDQRLLVTKDDGGKALIVRTHQQRVAGAPIPVQPPSFNHVSRLGESGPPAQPGKYTLGLP